MGFTSNQILAITVTERITSSLSFLGCAFVMLTFAFSKRFRRPVNRIMFYASIGNLVYTIPGFIAMDGIIAGPRSGLCQAQAFLIQFALPADALWNLSMALNVYFTVFKANDMSQLHSREPIFHFFNYVIPFGIALAFIFTSTADKGHVYGDATIWCWITPEWEYMRILVCYGPAWICILAAFTIYIMAGYKIIKERRGVLRAPQCNGMIDDAEARELEIVAKTTVQTTVGSSPPASPKFIRVTSPPRPTSILPAEVLRKQAPQTQYQVRISTTATEERRRHQMAVSGAVRRYTQSCMFFFVSLLMTWVPSSINRVWAVANPGQPAPFGLSYAAAFVLPLTGFWNSAVYIVMSWSSCRLLWHLDILPAFDAARKSVERSFSGSSNQHDSQFVSHRAPSETIRPSFGILDSVDSSK